MKEERTLEKYIPSKENLRDRLIDATKTNIQHHITEQSRQDPVHYSDWLALLGFENEQTALQYIQTGGIKTNNSKEE